MTLKKMEKLEIQLRDEIIKFMNVESEYTKNHSLFISNEILSIIYKMEIKLVPKYELKNKT